MDDLGAVLDAAGSERAALFGVSEGGPMSALFAATNPDRVSALVLYGTYARLLEAPDYPEGIRAEQLDALGGDGCASSGAVPSRSSSGRRAWRASRSSSGGGRGSYGRARARPGRSTC